MAQALSKGHNRRCILVDFPGFGKSEEPADAWDVGAYADMVKAFIKDQQLGGTDVLAHSFGGRVMLKIMAEDPNKTLVGKVLLTGGAGMKPKRKLSFYYRKYLAKTLKAPFQILPNPLKEKGLEKLRQTALWKSLGSSDYKTLQGVMRQVFVKTVGEYLEDTLPKINHDVFLLWGENDDATPLYQAERMEKGIKNAALVKIENAGHYAFLDQPGKFNIIADAFFKG